MSQQKSWSDLSFEDKKFFLWNAVPLKYGGDSTEVEEYLKEWGQEVTEANIDEAIRYVIRCFERDLWADNVGKQLLGRLLDGDLKGE